MPKRVDCNQKTIGADVQHVHTLGNGAPDLLAGFRGQNDVCEVTFGTSRLTDDEQRWHTRWSSCVDSIRSIDDAYRILGVTSCIRISPSHEERG